MPVTSTLMPATTVTSTTARPQPVPLETTLVLSRGATISGAVIDEETGLPIANVQIEAQSVVDGGPNSYASTGADGRYTLRGIAPGSYRIKTWTNSQNYVQEFYGDTFNWDDAILVTVRGTQPVEGVNIDLQRGTTVSGRVIDSATGLPISNIGISAGPADQGHIPGRRPMATATMHCGASPTALWMSLWMERGISRTVHGSGWVRQRLLRVSILI